MTPLAASNARVKQAGRLNRRPERSGRRLFLADGPKAVEGALGAGCVVEVFATPAAAEEYADILGEAPVTLVEDRAMRSLSDSTTPAGVVAVCRFVDVPLKSLVEEAADRPLVICADVRDPGNAGTVIRTADAVAASGVVLAGNSVDAYNPKTVRATVGSLFHLPLVLERDAADVLAQVRATGYVVLAADGAGELDLFDAERRGMLTGKVAWLFGNEAWGLPADLAAAADHRVSIPILGGAESLNLSTAAAVCLYASARALR